MFKLIHGIEDFDLSKLVSFNDNTTHGHTLKLNKPRCLKSLRLNAFPARCIDSWNKLPNDLVCSKSVDTFKNRLEVICRVTRFDTRGGTKHHKPPQDTTNHTTNHPKAQINHYTHPLNKYSDPNLGRKCCGLEWGAERV